MKKLLVILFVGVFAASANAATLSMLFDDGPVEQGPYPREEITLSPSQTAVLSIYIELKANDPGFAGLAGQFEGGDGLAAIGESPIPTNWNADSALGPLAVGVGNYSANYFSTDAVADALRGPGNYLLAEVVIHQLSEPIPPQDYEVVFYHNPSAFSWNLTKEDGGDFGFHPKWEAASYSGYYTYGKGAPDAGTAKTGYTYRDPLIVHCIPEPGSMALLVLGGLAALRRRR
jgi:hypothetical protein